MNYEEECIVEEARKILKRRVNKNRILDSPSRVRDWLQLELSGLSFEVFWVVFLDSQNRVLDKKEMFRGTLDGAAVYPRRLVEECVLNKAAAVILLHNHPSGVSEPSTADKRITDRLQSSLALIDVRILDHFIVTGDSTYSFAESGNL